MVPITLYRNGFMLFSGPFRSYTAQDSISFITDLYDGYFPYELKDRYPNGGIGRLVRCLEMNFVLLFRNLLFL